MDRIGLAATVSALVMSALGVGFVTLLTVGEGHLEKPQQSTATTVAADYLRDVRPILERRCIVCHGCYDAPCQLKLTSAEGISRGGSKDPVYNSQRLSVMEPTRLYIDAKSDKGWRRKGFFSVSAGEKGTDSTLQRMLDLGRAHPVATGKRLPKTVELDINRPLACPANASEFSEYARENPKGGMPYATAALTAREYSVLSSWAGKGAPADDPAPELSPALIAAILNWEAMLNGTSDKSRLSARYLYEHLFLAHLYFSDSDSKQFFRLVRSSTASGEPVNELDTRHANDDPGPDPFFYRLRPITATIVSKTHIVYPLSAAKLLRVREMLFGGEWQVSRLPGYIDETAGNPFAVFAEIPARSRYW
ncbi:MAG: hypothetical protein HOL85_05315 [Rhodospirillaceae bacterium]|nr:hypothetical protein [Rhodospirillaceae bacterium]